MVSFSRDPLASGSARVASRVALMSALVLLKSSMASSAKPAVVFQAMTALLKLTFSADSGLRGASRETGFCEDMRSEWGEPGEKDAYVWRESQGIQSSSGREKKFGVSLAIVKNLRAGWVISGVETGG